MGGGGQHPLQRREALGDEKGDVFKGLALHLHQEVIPPTHQVDRAHLIEVGDGMGDFLKAVVQFGADPDFDKGFDPLGFGQFIVIDEGFVSADDTVVLILGNAGRDGPPRFRRS